MNSISLTCQTKLSIQRSVIFRNFTDLNGWKTLDGYEPLPGIQNAEYETTTEEIAGTIIRTFNIDGSLYKESFNS